MLYNQYRPRDYSEVCGQEDSLITLKKQAATGRFSQAYLLAGPRGTGKTSIGRILSKAVNCLNPSEKGPCNACANCLSAKNSLDIVELDAASNNGVDKIKELVSKTKYKPVRLQKKVYLIGEVHNLSTGAFDALLKTIEEPPSYCVFILCTTELQKIPVTIISRCEQYTFNKIDTLMMKSRLRYVLKDQNGECEEGAMNLIVRHADGALRDALSILEQLLVCTDGKITTEAAKKRLGIMGEELVIQILDCILMQQTLDALNIYDELLKKGKAPGLVADNFLETLTDLITLISTQEPDSILHSQEYVSALTDMMARTNLERLFWLTDQFCELRAVIRGSVNPSMDIRLCIIKTSNNELIMSDPASLASELAAQRAEIDRLQEQVNDLRTGVLVERQDEMKQEGRKDDVSFEALNAKDAAPAPLVLNEYIEHPLDEREEVQSIPFESQTAVATFMPAVGDLEAHLGKEKDVTEKEPRENCSRQEGGMCSGERRTNAKKSCSFSVKDLFSMLS